MSEASTEQLQQKLIDLETQLAFQEDTIAALDKVVVKQQQQIERLNEMLLGTRTRLDEFIEQSDAVGKGIQDERPPHY